MSEPVGHRPLDGSPPTDVAIVGMACLLPGATDVSSYWENIVGKVDAIGDPPPDWEAELFYDPASSENDRIYCKRGGYLGELARFDPLEFGVVPSSIDGGEPDQFLALRVAHEALADAGCLSRPVDRERVEVIVGRGTYINRGFTTVVQHGLVVDRVLAVLSELHPEHTEPELQAIKRELKASLPPFHADMAPGLVPNLITGRISNRLDFMGTNYTVDAACASSLIAVDQAMQDLRLGRCDLALAGGVHASTPPPILQIFCQLTALSRSGQIRPFDKDADGTLLGEGLGFVVLKRLADAARDGDRIYAVIKEVGVASDGRAVGLLAPRVEGEELALRRAYEAAGISPGSIELIEAHGTGTPVGDAAEIESLTRVFGRRADALPRCALGTVKSMISHLIPAAGIAGLIKTALALHQKVLPPTLNCENPNPKLRLDETPFYINTEPRPWVHGARTPRRAGVNAFGFGGINAHAILEEHTAADATGDISFLRRWDAEVFILHADSRQGLVEAGGELEGFLDRAPRVDARDLAYTLGSELEGSAYRLGIVSPSIDDLRRKLAYALERLSDPDCVRISERSGIYFCEEALGAVGKLAFLFPGEGSQYPNMLADLCLHFPEVRAWFDLVDRAFISHRRGYLPSQAIFPPPGCAAGSGRVAPDGRLWQMDCGPEAIFAANQALFALLTRLGIRADVVVGHSTGEYSALVASGVHDVGEEQRLIQEILELNAIYERSLANGEIPEGVLVTVGGADPGVVRSLVAASGGRLHLAMDNCPHQLVMCGNVEVIDDATRRLKDQGFVCAPLPFRRAYHTPMFQPFCDDLRGFFQRLEIGPPRVELYSCATAQPYPADPEAIRRLAIEQWALPVRFTETVEAMYEAGVRVFVEVGPRNNLTSFVDDTLRDRPHLAVAADLPHRSGTEQLCHLVAQLAAHRMPLRLEHLWERRRPRRLSLADHEEAPNLSTAGMRLATGLQPLRLGNGRRGAGSLPPSAAPSPTSPAETPTPIPASGGSGRAPADLPRALRSQGVSAGRGVVVDEYLSTMERFLCLQQEVMQCYLTGTDGQSPRRDGPAHTDTPAQVASLPFVGTVVSMVSGREALTRRRLDLDEDLFLRHHTLGRGVSVTDEGLLGLPVVPLTMSMEILAEAAVALVPGGVVVGMRDVVAYRWIALDEGSLELETTARRREAGSADEVEVQMREVSAPSPAIEATVVLAPSYPEPPPARELGLRSARASRWVTGPLYGGLMFHGPSFQAVASVDRWDEDGAEAVLQTLPTDGLFRSTPRPGFLTDPVQLDAAGQVVGYWAAERFERAFHVFPFRVEALHLYGCNLRPGQLASCRARIVEVGARELRSDIDVVGPDGSLVARLEGWWDRRFDLPSNFYRLRISPCNAQLSELWPIPIARRADQGTFACCRVDQVSLELLGSHGRIWQRVLAQLVLSRREREEWRHLEGSQERRSEWLLGRVAAKDAVRHLLAQSHGMALCPADVDIVRDEHGRPRPEGRWADSLRALPTVSVAHCDGVVAAVAGADESCRGVGIDVERARPLPQGFERGAFSAGEQDLLGALDGPAQEEWAMRLWCAKEAVGKALGRGLFGRPRALVAQDINAQTGTVAVRLSAELAAELPELAGVVIRADTARDGDVVVAVAAIADPERRPQPWT